jgi:hypothetical protein
MMKLRVRKRVKEKKKVRAHDRFRSHFRSNFLCPGPPSLRFGGQDPPPLRFGGQDPPLLRFGGQAGIEPAHPCERPTCLPADWNDEIKSEKESEREEKSQSA